MARPHLLLVDADPRVVRVMEVNLKNDGFSVTTATDGADAAARLEYALPDVLVAETRLPRVDGFELVRRLRSLPGGEHVAVVLIAPEAGGPGPNGLSASAMDQLRSVELGIGDCLCKPVSVRELVTRVNLMLARRTQALLASSSAEQKHFSGHLQDTGVIDLLQAFESGRRSGVLQIEHATRSATVLFKNGKVVDAEQGQLRGEEALYRTFLWTSGVFDVEFGEVDVTDNVPIGTAALVMEGMRRIDEWGRLAEQLPSSASVFTVDADVLIGRLAEVPDELNPVLRLFDGRRSLMAVIDESPFDDLSTLSVVSKLYFEGVLRVTELAPASLLGTARALGMGTPKTGGNVIRLPHVGIATAAVVVRPNAPSITADPVPRSLVYSEPPQNLRLSQRPKGHAVSASTLPGAVAAAPPVSVSEKPRAVSAEPAVAPRNVVEARPVEVRVADEREGKGAARAVPEAEFEDLSDKRDVWRPKPQSVTSEPVRETSAARAEVAVPKGAGVAAATPADAAVSEAAGAAPAENVVEMPPKAGKEVLDHDFFSDGDEGNYPAHADDEAQPRPDVDIDPRVLAALQARREQGRRWATWIVGAALLFVVWGVVAVLGRGSSEDSDPSDSAAGQAATAGGPAAPSSSSPLAMTPPPTEPVVTFEEVPPLASTAKAPGAPLVGKGLGPMPTGLPSDLGPVRPLPRGKRPPTARFPSTPENQ